MNLRICPDCKRLLETRLRKRSGFNTYRYYCNTKKCEVIEVKYTKLYNHTPQISEIVREATPRPKPLNWLTVEIITVNPYIGLLSNMELKEKGYFE